MYTRVFGVSERSWREKCVGLRAVRRRRGLLVLVASAAVLVVLGTAAVPSSVAAHAGDDASDEVRIVARKLEDGRVEFGLQQRESEDSWGERMLPATRFFPADATVDRWLRSSPLTVHVAATGDRAATDVMVRIVARKLANGKVEFGLRKQLPDDSWSGELLPSVRMFPTTAAVGSWLQSTAISVLTTQPTATTSTTQPTATTSTAPPSRLGSQRWLRATLIRAGCGRTTPWPAGATTPTANPIRRGRRTRRWRAAKRIPAGFAPMAPRRAGAGTTTGKASRRPVRSPR